MNAPHRIYLVPGFFGFVNLGEVVYFGHVRDFLVDELARRGVAAQVIPVATHPTASSEVRVRELVAAIDSTASGDDGPIHLVGHSTGGLDARLFTSPTSGLSGRAEELAPRVRSVVTVSTPHHGTPLSDFFLGFGGNKLLQLLSLFTVTALRRGRLPSTLLLRLIGAVVRADDRFFTKQSLIDQLFGQLLSDLSEDRQAALTRFFEQMVEDQSLIPQLTPEGMAAFNLRIADRPKVRYGSVVTLTPRPTMRTRLDVGLGAYAQLTHSLYKLLWDRTCRFPADRLPPLSKDEEALLVRAYGRVPGAEDNDGIVPTRSQPHGELLAAVLGDHLDAIGHFDWPAHSPPHVDWMVSGSHFRRGSFESLWIGVVRFLLGE